MHPHQPFGVGAAQDPGLLQEAVAHVQVVQQGTGQYLDGHLVVQVVIEAQPDGGEGSLAQDAINSVTADGRRHGHPDIMPKEWS
ncbi:hypothetical protein GCM10010439_11120 [Actinocorallia aurantiaca]|uniref:Uncharacterized protein n=1 Tax=Actinocorallia aurantiaca TaxID=46204 RepID=A0ABN3TYP9_9ACTN